MPRRVTGGASVSSSTDVSPLWLYGTRTHSYTPTTWGAGMEPKPAATTARGTPTQPAQPAPGVTPNIESQKASLGLFRGQSDAHMRALVLAGGGLIAVLCIVLLAAFTSLPATVCSTAITAITTLSAGAAGHAAGAAAHNDG